MQQRLELCCTIEVPELFPEEDVRAERSGSEQALSVVAQIEWQEHQERQCGRHHKHEEERRKNPSRSTFVKLDDREISGLDLSQQERRDEEPRDDEEHVHADETAAQAAQPVVVEHDRQDRQRPESVQIGPVTQWRFTWGQWRGYVTGQCGFAALTKDRVNGFLHRGRAAAETLKHRDDSPSRQTVPEWRERRCRQGQFEHPVYPNYPINTDPMDKTQLTDGGLMSSGCSSETAPTGRCRRPAVRYNHSCYANGNSASKMVFILATCVRA
jgi:hypothetical protein